MVGSGGPLLGCGAAVLVREVGTLRFTVPVPLVSPGDGAGEAGGALVPGAALAGRRTTASSAGPSLLGLWTAQ